MGITTGNLASALKHMLFVSCIPITFSHTKYNGVQANPKVINCVHMPTMYVMDPVKYISISMDTNGSEIL